MRTPGAELWEWCGRLAQLGSLEWVGGHTAQKRLMEETIGGGGWHAVL
jgi:hypothetical protein